MRSAEHFALMAFNPSGRRGIAPLEAIGMFVALSVGVGLGTYLLLDQRPADNGPARGGPSTIVAKEDAKKTEHASGTSAQQSEEQSLAAGVHDAVKALDAQDAEIAALRHELADLTKVEDELHSNKPKVRATEAAAEAEAAYDVSDEEDPFDVLVEDVIEGKELPATRRAKAKANKPANANSSAAKSATNHATGDSHKLQGKKTLAYWNELNRIMGEEEQMRAVPDGGLTAANAADFLTRRGEAGRYAAQSIRALPGDGVDAKVVALGGKIAAWYEEGVSNNNRAEYLLGRGSEKERRGSAGKQWSGQEKEHNTSVADINREGDQLRHEMNRKYGLVFPDLR